jgi:DNA primase
MGQAEEIKSKLDIVEVIREYIPVKAIGANFQALCPFHNEKTPSFVISPDKQIWHCFGCGRGGDVFSFVMEKEGLGFMETLRLLAPKAGVTLKYENPEEYSKRNRVLDILELAGKYYAHLLTTSTGQTARDYLLQRGLSEEAIQDWQLGFSPDAWDSLYSFLKARPLTGNKYTDEEIFLAGLIIKKDRVSSGQRAYYDRFRDRIMFPIWDVNNNIVAFTARVNPAKEPTEKMGKYINSPQTKVYDKSRILFALNKAKAAIKKEDLAIVVEGQMDAISCHQHGFLNTVASSGTALTAEQVALIKRFTNNIALSFDMDDAGQMAADRGIKECLAQDINLRVIILPSGKDPDESLRNNPEDFRRAVQEAKPMLEYYFEKISRDLDLSELANKQLVLNKMLGMLSLVHNRVEQDFWLQKLSDKLSIQDNILRESLAKMGAGKSETRSTSPSVIAAETSESVSREEKLAELLLAILIRFPEFFSYAANNIEPEFLAKESLIRFYNNLIIYYNKIASLDYQDLRLYLEEVDSGAEKLLDKLILLGEKDFYNYEAPQVKQEIINILSELKKYARQKTINKLQQEISQAEKRGDQSEIDKLMNTLNNLMNA